MTRRPFAIEPWTVAAVVVLSGIGADPMLRADGAALHGQTPAVPPRPDPARTARLRVTVPHLDTVLSLDGRAVIGSGTVRELDTPPLAAGERRRVVLVATWNPNVYTTITRTKDVVVRAGENLAVDLSREDPTDRVKVIYVPTPADIAQQMVEMAGVTAADVVFEPGCGDARITIAAIRSGARRGICVDLDPERAVESRANVQNAGLANRIDVRQGDALDVKDLSDVSVVFLYMGDHFNELIRPVLWRSLKPGARIVSHRFRMGDWEPDKTETVQSTDDGGMYELHLWTITDAVKRKVQR